MTNAQIISSACILAGITEPVHTYAAWKAMGYTVKKGEHSVLKLSIWKHSTKKNKDGEEEAHMFMTPAHFFAASQVEKRTA